MADVQLTWLGHSAFRVDTPGGKRIYVDPFLQNPICPEGERNPERVDLIVLTHGHDDHVGDTVVVTVEFRSYDLNLPFVPFIGDGVVKSSATSRVDYAPAASYPECPRAKP